MSIRDEPLWGNVGAALQGNLLGTGTGWAPDLSEIGFWGGPAVLQAYHQAKEGEQEQYKQRSAERIASTQAETALQDAVVRAALGLLQNQTNVTTKLAEIQSNKELQQALKQLGVQEKIYGEQQHNSRTQLEQGTKLQSERERTAAMQSMFKGSIPADVARTLAQNELKVTNPKYTPEDLTNKTIEIQQRAQRATPTQSSSTLSPEVQQAFLKQAANDMINKNGSPQTSGSLPMSPASFIQGAITQAIPTTGTSASPTMEQMFGPTQPGDNPLAAAAENITRQNALRGIGDYTISPQDRADALAYYSDKGNYNPTAPRTEGANPMAKYVSDFRFPKDEEGFQAPSAREIYDRVAQEFQHSPIMGYDVIPGKLSLTGKREADQVYPVRSQYQKAGFQTYGPGATSSNPNSDGIRYNPQLEVNSYPLFDRAVDALMGEGRPQSSGYQAGSFPLKLAPNQPQWTGPIGGYDLKAAVKALLSRMQPGSELPQWSL